MRAGLVSVTFRQLSAERIIDLAVGCGLECIEWGGDFHVPANDLAGVRETGRRTRDAGLAVTSYGSYYRVGGDEAEGATFASLLEAAAALWAPAIRVWAGNVGSAQADAAQRVRVVADARRIGAMAAAAGVRVAFEFHDGTLTDTAESAVALLEECAEPALATLWQPPHGRTLEFCAESLRVVLSHLQHVHAFHWWPDHTARHPLAEGAARWTRYVEVLREGSWDGDVLLEFVPGDDAAVLGREAATLRGWLGK